MLPRVMRELIIGHARNRRAQKRSGQFQVTSLGTEAESAVDCELLPISEALDDLPKPSPSR